MSKLFAGRFKTFSASNQMAGGTMAEAFDEPERIGIRWNIEGYGVERIEVTVKAKSRLDQYNRMNEHFGGVNQMLFRLGVFDNTINKCVSGFITGIRPEGTRSVTYVAKGPKWNHYDLYGPTYTSYSSSDTTSDQLKQFLDDDVKILSSDLSGIEETGTALGGWRHPAQIGMYPGDFVDYARKASNSNGQLWDYYCMDLPMSFGNLQDYKPYFRNRANRTTVNWKVSINDLARLDLDRDVSDFRSIAVVWYGTYTGTATGGSATTLTHSGATFLDGRFSVGDEIKNITDGSSARITAISSNTQIVHTTLTGGSSNTFASGNVYSIQSKTLWNHESQVNASFEHWNRYRAEHHPQMTSTQADQYAAALHNFYSTPIQSAAFAVSSPWIHDGSGARWPLWQPIFDGGGLIQITDMYPAAASTLSNDGTNNLDTFFITAMDYDYTSNQLRVSVNVPDSRLDARLKMAGILGSEMISRA